MFWFAMIVLWMMVHKGTEGRYVLRGSKPEHSAAVTVLFIALGGAAVGIFAPVNWFWQAALAGFLWFAILFMRSAREAKPVLVEDIEAVWRRQMGGAKKDESLQQQLQRIQKTLQTPPAGQAAPARPITAEPGNARRETQIGHNQRGDLRDRPAGSIPHKHAKGAKISSQGQAPEQYQQYRTEKETVSAGAQHDQLSPQQPGHYSSELDEVMQVARDVLQAKPRSTSAYRQPTMIELPDDPPLAPLQEVPEAVSAAAAAAVFMENDAQQETPANSAEAAAQADAVVTQGSTDSRGWQPPQFVGRVSQAESSTPRERPASIFGNTGPTSLGTGVGSIFGRQSSESAQAVTGGAVDELIASNKLNKHEELAKPKSVLEEAEKETGGGFLYKPTAGVKSRF